ncbi:hypothetical protein C5B85_15295 [Pseudoclavibacter sp. AY1F1]|nr:hypothetical protein C5B85_15295 [Pseudoclavibacter sp. AY1F1]
MELGRPAGARRHRRHPQLARRERRRRTPRPVGRPRVDPELAPKHHPQNAQKRRNGEHPGADARRWRSQGRTCAGTHRSSPTMSAMFCIVMASSASRARGRVHSGTRPDRERHGSRAARASTSLAFSHAGWLTSSRGNCSRSVRYATASTGASRR